MIKRIKDIITTPVTKAIDQKDMIYVVQEYIKERKCVDVKISMPHPATTRILGYVVAGKDFGSQSNKLAIAYNHAQAYYLKQL